MGGRPYWVRQRDRCKPWQDERLRARIHAAQGAVCAGCGFAVMGARWWRPRKDGTLTADHVYPKGRGGAWGAGNLVMMHRRCNDKKADRMPTGCEIIWLWAVNARLGLEPVGP